MSKREETLVNVAQENIKAAMLLLDEARRTMKGAKVEVIRDTIGALRKSKNILYLLDI